MTAVYENQPYVCNKLICGLISWLSGSGLNLARFLIIGGSMG